MLNKWKNKVILHKKNFRRNSFDPLSILANILRYTIWSFLNSINFPPKKIIHHVINHCNYSICYKLYMHCSMFIYKTLRGWFWGLMSLSIFVSTYLRGRPQQTVESVSGIGASSPGSDSMVRSHSPMTPTLAETQTHIPATPTMSTYICLNISNTSPCLYIVTENK